MQGSQELNPGLDLNLGRSDKCLFSAGTSTLDPKCSELLLSCEIFSLSLIASEYKGVNRDFPGWNF